MRFLCLLHFDQAEMNALDAAELAQMDREAEAYDARLMASGHYVTALALAAPQSAVLVRSRDGVVSSTDGPFAETKEQLGGFYLAEASDLDDALAIAGRIPGARCGSVEVRPVMALP